MSKIEVRINNAILWHRDNLDLILDINDPKIFSEKIVWLYKNYFTKDGQKKSDWDKIYDKIGFKNHIKENFGPEYTAELYGEYDHADEINFQKLPELFVLKSTRGNWGKEVKIVNKTKDNLEEIRTVAAQWVATPGTAKIIAEQYISGADTDYKFYISGGQCLFINAETRQGENIAWNDKVGAFYDQNWNPQPFYFKGDKLVEKGVIPPPKNLEKMLCLAKKAAAPFPFMRVDFFESENGDVYFSEFCGFPREGKVYFMPDEWNRKLGDMVKMSR